MIELGLAQVLMCLLAFFLVIELGLTWGLVSLLHQQTNPVNFVLFSTVWSIILLAYLFIIPKFIPRLFRHHLAFSLLSLTFIFWLSGSIALSVWVGIPSHPNNKQRLSQASSVFGFFIWAIFSMLMWMDWKSIRQDKQMRKENSKNSSLGTEISSSTYQQSSGSYAESSVV